MSIGQPYRDRHEAGRILAADIRERVGSADAVVFALPRGGVPVGLQVARVLEAPLDVCVVCSLGWPQHPDVSLGAIASGGYEVLNDRVIHQRGISPLEIASLADRGTTELQRREARYRAALPPQDPYGRVAVLVDEALADRLALRAALSALRDQGATRLIVAAPVGCIEACEELAEEVGEVVCPFRPNPFDCIETWYGDRGVLTDEEVAEYLAAAAREQEHLHLVH